MNSPPPPPVCLAMLSPYSQILQKLQTVKSCIPDCELMPCGNTK